MEFNNFIIQVFLFVFVGLVIITSIINIILYYKKKLNGEFIKTHEDFVEYNKKVLKDKK